MWKHVSAILIAVCLVSGVQAGGLFDIAPLTLNGKTPTIDPGHVGNSAQERVVVNVDVTGDNSWDEVGDPSNETPSFDLASLAGFSAGTPVDVRSVGWDLQLSVVGFSWFSEAVISFGDDLGSPSLFLQPGIGDDFESGTPMNYTSGGLISLDSLGFPDLELNDGVVDVEYYELFDDVADTIDASYIATSTLSFEVFRQITGDFNGDGDFACDDVDLLVLNIVNGTNDPAFDLTGDGLVNPADLAAWLEEAGAAELASGNPYLPADVNLDGFVDAVDFTIWNDNKFTTIAAFCSGDMNADGFVDAVDFTIWNDNKFMAADGVSAVPEPASGLFVALMLVAILSQRRR